MQKQCLNGAYYTIEDTKAISKRAQETRGTTSPTIIVNPEIKTIQNDSIPINIRIEGNESGLKNYKYVITDSPDPILEIEELTADVDSNSKSGLYYGSDFTSWTDLKANGSLVVSNGVLKKLEPSSQGALVIDSEITRIDERALYNCADLSKIVFKEGITSIGDYAFSECRRVTAITFPNSLITIGNGAFEGCSKIKSVVIPRGVTTIGWAAFCFCPLIETITVDPANKAFDSRNNCNGIIRKSDNSFIAGCKNSVIPNGIVTIGRAAFNGCYDLKSITIPNTVTTLEWDAFQGCRGLTQITIPQGVKTIGNTAFNMCTGLTSLTVPNGVTSIGYLAFCDVAHVYYRGSAKGAPWGAKIYN